MLKPDNTFQVGQTTEQLSSHYESRFLQNMQQLNVLRPTIVHRVSDNVQNVIEFIERLVESGHAYVTGQGLLSALAYTLFR